MAAGLSWKDAVRVTGGTGNNLALSGLLTVDTVTLSAGDRVLAIGQTTASQNGIYIAAAGAWTRATDVDTGPEIEGMAVFVMEGLIFADTAWVCTTNAPDHGRHHLLDLRPVRWWWDHQCRCWLVQNGTSFDVIAGDASLVVSANSISRGALTGDVTASFGSNATTIADGVVTNAKLASMPGSPMLKGRATVGAGVVEDVNMVTLQGMVANYLGRKYQTVVSGGATTFTATHNFNSVSVAVEVFRNSAPFDTIDCDVERPTNNTVLLRFATAPSTNEYAVVVLG
jgi:hypothetical protein